LPREGRMAGQLAHPRRSLRQGRARVDAEPLFDDEIVMRPGGIKAGKCGRTFRPVEVGKHRERRQNVGHVRPASNCAPGQCRPLVRIGRGEIGEAGVAQRAAADRDAVDRSGPANGVRRRPPPACRWRSLYDRWRSGQPHTPHRRQRSRVGSIGAFACDRIGVAGAAE
jgi:hypothetical protein